jgi:hypothetical protein
MKTITQITALTTALLLGAASFAGPVTTARAEEGEGITWSVSPGSEAGGLPSIEFRQQASSSGFSLEDDRGWADVQGALSGTGDAAFAVVREAGSLACRGTTERPFSGRGTCTFDPDEAFVRDLRARHLAPDRRSDLLAMALLGVTRGLIDGLAREGVSPSSADEVIAAAALEVTPEYVASLRGAGLTLAKLDDAVACKALDVNAAYVRSLEEAGVHADAEQVVAMKAVGVTPEYARRMADAAQD